MRAYMRYEQGEVRELSEVGCKQVQGLVDRADFAIVTPRPYGLGFYRSEADFLELTPVGQSEFLVWSDLIIGRRDAGWVRSLLGSKQHLDIIVKGREAAAAVVLEYMDSSRQAFERKFREA